jgi:uncharacterized membrane protein YkoI
MTIKTIALGLASAGALAAGSAHAKWIPELPHMLDRCVENVTAAYPGTVMGSDTSWENNALVYEVDVRTDAGQRLSVECAALTGALLEVEKENQAAVWNAFKSTSNLSEIQARHIALQAMPGKIVESEREYELNGGVAYEFEIVQADGVRGEIEIDARTGLVRERGYEIEHSRYW